MADVDIGAEASGPFVTIHVKDVPAVVKAKAGPAGALLSSLAPKTIEAQVYSSIQGKVREALSAEGVDAEVAVVALRPPGPSRFSRDLLAGAALGAGAVGLGLAIRALLKRFITKGR